MTAEKQPSCLASPSHCDLPAGKALSCGPSSNHLLLVLPSPPLVPDFLRLQFVKRRQGRSTSCSARFPLGDRLTMAQLVRARWDHRQLVYFIAVTVEPNKLGRIRAYVNLKRAIVAIDVFYKIEILLSLGKTCFKWVLKAVQIAIGGWACLLRSRKRICPAGRSTLQRICAVKIGV